MMCGLDTGLTEPWWDEEGRLRDGGGVALRRRDVRGSVGKGWVTCQQGA
jgi:hypothetical protein